MASVFRGRASAPRGPGAAVLLACALASCDHAQSLDPDGDSPPIVGTASAGFAGGIPIGMFAQPLSEYGDRYNGGHRNTSPGDLVSQLSTIRSRGGKAVVTFPGADTYYKDSDGHFSLSLWQARVDRYRGVNFSSFVDDGTIIAHYLVDEPNDPANWNGERIPGETVEAMARYSKEIWPDMPTVVRVDPGYLRQWDVNYHYLDAAWAQYVHRKGEVNDYLAKNVADAQALGLELIVGLNLLDGGPNTTEMTAQQIEDWGSVLLASPYPCAFVSWKYDGGHLSGAGIGEAMDVLRGLAQSHGAKSCRHTGSSPGPDPDPDPEPDPPAATTTTIVADSPDPSTPGQPVTVTVTVEAGGNTPDGTVTVTATGGSESCEATVSDGSGSCALTLTETGDRTLRASFEGGSAYEASSDTEAHDVEAGRRSVSVAWATPQDISYGTALGGSQLNATATADGAAVPGTFSYSPAAGTVLDAGADQALRVDFTPSDPARYESGSGSVALDVLPRTPTLTWTAPSSIQVGPLSSSVLNARATGVGGTTVSGTFTYSPAAGQVLDASPARTLSVSFQPSSGNYTAATRSVTLAVLYPWSGFFSPVDNAGRLNTAKAGVAIPVRFSLGGNRTAPLASGYPQVQSVSCPSWPTDAIEQTVSASSSGLKYDSPTGRYVYTWKTSSSWTNGCRRLIFVFKDGTRREATFRLSR